MTATLSSPSGAGRQPDLGELVERAGGYDRITPAMWAGFESAVARWWTRYRAGLPTGDRSKQPNTKGRKT